MRPSNSKLLTAIAEAVRDLEGTYGSQDPGVICAKHLLVECLGAVRLIETPEEAQLFLSAQRLAEKPESNLKVIEPGDRSEVA